MALAPTGEALGEKRAVIALGGADRTWREFPIISHCPAVHEAAKHSAVGLAGGLVDQVIEDRAASGIAPPAAETVGLVIGVALGFVI